MFGMSYMFSSAWWATSAVKNWGTQSVLTRAVEWAMLMGWRCHKWPACPLVYIDSPINVMPFAEAAMRVCAVSIGCHDCDKIMMGIDARVLAAVLPTVEWSCAWIKLQCTGKCMSMPAANASLHV
jgi:hypothetical protein